MQVIGLEACTALTRLDLSDNEISHLDGIAACTSLRWLSLAKNSIVMESATSFSSILKELINLQVLNLAHNKFSGNVSIGCLRSLKALILNNNNIVKLTGLHNLTELDTLVLSSNAVKGGKHLEDWLQGASALEKLSLSQNPLKVISGAGLGKCSMLRELRINHCQLKRLPDCIKHNARLRILEGGGNEFENVDDISIVGSLPFLEHVAFKGCPFAGTSGYENLVHALIPSLQTLDNKKVLSDSTAKGKGSRKKVNQRQEKDLERQDLEEQHKNSVVEDEDDGLDPADLMVLPNSAVKISGNQSTGVVKVTETKSKVKATKRKGMDASQQQFRNTSKVAARGKAALNILQATNDIESLGGWD
jgi:hypothetical protein